MKIRLLNWWYWLRSSFWFVPALMAVGAVGLAILALAADEAWGLWVVARVGWLDAGGPEGARALLATVAGSMMTIVGVVFSITIVALTLASSQLGPRLLSNFMRDTGNQVVLGMFLSTFLYCLLVLRRIRGVEGREFVPHLSVALAVGLTLASLAVLIFFFHHVASTIQADNVVARVGGELREFVHRLFPEKASPEEPETVSGEGALPEDFEQRSRAVESEAAGYLEAMDLEGLVKLAAEHDLLIRVELRPGEFVLPGAVLARVSPGDRSEEDVERRIRDAFILGGQRTAEQDVEYAIHQIVEIAVRALSPGVNDPYTAITCIDRLGAALAHLTRHCFPPAEHYDEEKRLRLVTKPARFAGVTDAAFNQIRQYGCSSAAVMIRLLEVLAELGRQARTAEVRQTLLRHARMVQRDAAEAIPQENDRWEVEQRYRKVCMALGVKDEEA